MRRSLSLKVKPVWDEIEIVRNEATIFLTELGLGQEKVQAMAMVVSELLENAIKYGVYHSADDEIAVTVKLDGNLITTEVSNPVDDQVLPHLKALDQMIQWIRGYQDPFEAYTQRLKEISKKALNDEASGLGLVRVAYEGQAILDFFLGDNGRVNVSAVSGQ